jgi:hypothetical protein
MLKCIRKLIDETVEDCMDDIIVKFKKADQLVADLEKTFERLQVNDIKLNPKKCIFRVPRGMLLGFIISERDIKANPEKISAITKMGLIQNIKWYSESLGASWRSAALSHTSTNEASPFTGF